VAACFLHNKHATGVRSATAPTGTHVSLRILVSLSRFVSRVEVMDRLRQGESSARKGFLWDGSNMECVRMFCWEESYMSTDCNERVLGFCGDMFDAISKSLHSTACERQGPYKTPMQIGNMLSARQRRVSCRFEH